MWCGPVLLAVGAVGANITMNSESPLDKTTEVALFLTTGRFTGPYNNIWDDDECSNMRNIAGITLSICMSSCEQANGCTAIAYGYDTGATRCVLRACTLPVPVPQWNHPLYKGYSMKTESPPELVCRTSRACRRRTGFCMPSSEICNGRVVNKGCGPKCTCCAMEPTQCRERRSCREANGTCIMSSGSCAGFFLENGCTGSSGCLCCVNGMPTSSDTTTIMTTTSRTTTPGASTTRPTIARTSTTIATTKAVTLATRASTTTDDYTTCPVGYSEVAGKCYFFSKLHDLPRRSWNDARLFCQSMSNEDYSVDLIVLENFTTLQEDPVLNYMYSQGMWYTWFGATFSPSANTWSWLDGCTFTSNSSMWSPGQPNDEGNSNCAAFGYSVSYFSMFDIPCSWTRDYACQIHALN